MVVTGGVTFGSGGATDGASGCCIGNGIVCAAIDDEPDASAGHAVTGTTEDGRFGCATVFTARGGVHPVESRFDAGIAGGAALTGGTFTTAVIMLAAPASEADGGGDAGGARRTGASMTRFTTAGASTRADRIGVSNGEIFAGAIVTTAFGFDAAIAAIARGLVNGITLGCASSFGR